MIKIQRVSENQTSTSRNIPLPDKLTSDIQMICSFLFQTIWMNGPEFEWSTVDHSNSRLVFKWLKDSSDKMAAVFGSVVVWFI